MYQSLSRYLTLQHRASANLTLLTFHPSSSNSQALKPLTRYFSSTSTTKPTTAIMSNFVESSKNINLPPPWKREKVEITLPSPPSHSKRHTNFEAIIAQESLDEIKEQPSVFLAGSIEMGKAVEWQSNMTAHLQHAAVTVLNPRCGNWDPNTVSDISDPKFRGQVGWELKAMDKATVIAMYLDENTVSPISLLELGLFAKSNKLVVCCPRNFWRKGNVQVMAAQYGFPLIETYEEFLPIVKERLGIKAE
jgi:hypothetical protein